MANLTSGGTESTAAAIGAAVLAASGIDPQTLLWSACGSTIGMTLAPQTSRYRAVALFVAVVFFCAMVGDLFALHYFSTHQQVSHWRNGAAAVSAAVFHPIFQAVTQNVPSIFEWLLKRAGIKQ